MKKNSLIGFNPKNVEKVTLESGEKQYIYKYRNPIFRSRGWYQLLCWGLGYYWGKTTLDEVLKECVVEDNVAHKKPEVTIHFKGGKTISRKDSVLDAEETFYNFLELFNLDEI